MRRQCWSLVVEKSIGIAHLLRRCSMLFNVLPIMWLDRLVTVLVIQSWILSIQLQTMYQHVFVANSHIWTFCSVFTFVTSAICHWFLPPRWIDFSVIQSIKHLGRRRQHRNRLFTFKHIQLTGKVFDGTSTILNKSSVASASWRWAAIYIWRAILRQ